MVKIFFDAEFTGLHQRTTLISLGMIADTGQELYAEFTDYDPEQVDDWLKENVMPGLIYKDQKHSNFTLTFNDDYPSRFRQDWFGLRVGFPTIFDSWLHGLPAVDEAWQKNSTYTVVEMWSDCLAFDWVLFCELFGGALKIPKYIYYIPFDISTLFKSEGIDPDINREEFAGMTEDVQKHNALWDAKVIKACYEKLTAVD